MCLVDMLEMHLYTSAAPNYVRRFLKGHTMNLHIVVGSKIGNYECEECDKDHNVDVINRTVLRDLPNTLVILLRRFDYQPPTGNRVNINDKFELPIEEDLDLKPFTWEAMQVREEKLSSMKRFSKADTAIMLEKIGRKENLKNLQVPHNNESKDKLRPENYNKYRLQGIINHSGTANAGHFISFARERDAPHQWHEFNDDRVRLLPSPAVETLKAEAFGESFLYDTALIDPEILKKKRLSLLSEADTVKPYSACILIYERKQPVDDWSL
ncbi:putative Ubiquitin carboxyl-terminal hydrolase family protein [Monocercomonoides exilis]|uniref:putative Ubiquitin carboxyl-terminal hydrolase family protein n=1 Tax=Monocercomonoides exilis TaxID=2049356 RepID=UPI003559DFA0|nr:putative Ubiquitin carboxyl-terminal hydrolase family protein [Monocercomonoides exilis]|eukprot:MONOS_15044.1-p1 / transcript=MONOS_15044.1 / gene=MONOS_15044 / organism=Monocercomonoides_exilis_PA203 / gene_product=Ubiquitin carboxyl-terminal hydrolase family protein / transcript_product=Ubiquitin carboxyl-terminal hydrolase family protein / location=Mono_scaffold01132:9538-10443(-) / protein_length=268 / sequence_SO=supercontig / SO=protein_coding / is_pseudo=false